MADQEVRIRITTDATGAIVGFNQVKNGVKDVEAHTQGIASKIKSHWLGISAAIAGAAVTMRAAWNLAEQAAQFEQSKTAFHSMVQSMSGDAEKLYATLRQKSAGLIDEKSLTEAANRAMSLGIPIEKLGDLMEIARAKARDMGITTTQAFNDIALGVGRASPKILDNLGLMLKIGTANEKMADSLGKTVEQLTDKEKQMALLNATIDAGKEALERYDLSQLSTMEKMQKLTATVKDLQLMLGQGLIRAAAGAVGVFQAIETASMKASEYLYRFIATFYKFQAATSIREGSKEYYTGKANYWTYRAMEDKAAAEKYWKSAKDNFEVMISKSEELAAAMRTTGDIMEDGTNKIGNAAEKIGKMTEAQKEHLKLQAEAARIYEATRTPLEVYNIQVERLVMLLHRGYIDQELFIRALERAKETLADAVAGADQPEGRGEDNTEKIINARKEFTLKYSELGKSAFDLERAELARQVEAWRQAEVDKTQLMEYESRRRAQINREEFHTRLDTVRGLVGGVASLFEDLAEADARYSREAFYVYKAFKMAEVQISTASAVMKAFEGVADKSGIGLALAYMQAAMAGAFGIMQTALIANAQPPSYDEGGVSTRPGIYYSGVPEAHIPLKGGSVPVEIKGEEKREIRLEIANIVSPELLDAYIASPRGRRAMLNFIGQNAGTVRRVIRH